MSIKNNQPAWKSILSGQLHGKKPFLAEKGFSPISPVGSVGTSACSRGVHRRQKHPFPKTAVFM